MRLQMSKNFVISLLFYLTLLTSNSLIAQLKVVEYEEIAAVNEQRLKSNKNKIYILGDYNAIRENTDTASFLYNYIKLVQHKDELDTANFIITFIIYKFPPEKTSCGGHRINGKKPLESFSKGELRIYVDTVLGFKNLIKKKAGLIGLNKFLYNTTVLREGKTTNKKDSSLQKRDSTMFNLKDYKQSLHNLLKIITINKGMFEIEHIKFKVDSLYYNIESNMKELRRNKINVSLNTDYSVYTNVYNSSNLIKSGSQPIVFSSSLNFTKRVGKSSWLQPYFGGSINYLTSKLILQQIPVTIKEISREFNTDNNGEYYQRVTYAENIQETVKFQFASVGATIGLNIRWHEDKSPLSIEYGVSVPVVHTFSAVNTAGTYTTGGIYPNYLANDTLFSSKPNFVKSQQFDKTNTKLNYVPQIMHRIGISFPLVNRSSFILSLTGNYNYMNFQNMNIRDELFGDNPSSKYFSLLSTQNNLRIQNASLGVNLKLKF